MSKTKTPKTPKTPAKAKATKTTTVDAGGGILVDVVEAAPAKKPAKPRKVSGLDAAAQVLKDKGQPMTCKDIVETMLAKKLWSTKGKTPASTLYSAILREIDGKPGDSRFAKTGRGLFTLTKA